MTCWSTNIKARTPILDIAAIESTKPDGSRQSFELDGVTYFSMVPEYTTDGGHLNEIGRKIVAEQFVAAVGKFVTVHRRDAEIAEKVGKKSSRTRIFADTRG
jgi:hypothetical protein